MKKRNWGGAVISASPGQVGLAECLGIKPFQRLGKLTQGTASRGEVPQGSAPGGVGGHAPGVTEPLKAFGTLQMQACWAMPIQKSPALTINALIAHAIRPQPVH